MIKYFLFIPALTIFFCSNIFADQVIMTNGDRLTGKIVYKDGDSIVIKSEFAGTVKIKWSAVAEIVAEEPLSVTLADGKTVEGKIETEEKNY